MRADPVLVRRIGGLASVVLLIGVSAVGLEARFSSPGSYEVSAELGRAGTGLRSDSDVKLRGVNIGRVAQVVIDDAGEVTATLQLDPEPRLPEDVRPVVTPKTFLGEKQVELRTDRRLQAPFLEDGATLAVAPEDLPVEPVAVVDELGRLLRDIDDHKLAAFFDAMAAFDEDDADLFAGGIDTGAELAAFLSRTGPDQIDRLGDTARAMDAIADAGDELERLARSLPDGVAPVVDNRAQLVAALDSMAPFAEVFGEYLRVEEEAIGAALRVGDRIGGVVDPRLDEIGSMIFGIYRYSLMLGQHGGDLNDGTEYALFRAFIGEEGQFLELCEQLPDELAQVAPGCVAADAS